MITDEQLAAWQKLCDAQKSTEWREGGVYTVLKFYDRNSSYDTAEDGFDFDRHVASPFIAVARTAMPLLLEEISSHTRINPATEGNENTHVC